MLVSVCVAVVVVSVCVAVVVVFGLLGGVVRVGATHSPLVSSWIVFAPWVRFDSSVESTPPMSFRVLSNRERSSCAAAQSCSESASETLLSCVLRVLAWDCDSSCPLLPHPTITAAATPAAPATIALCAKPIGPRL